MGIDGENAKVDTVSGNALPDEKITKEVLAAIEKAKWSVREVERKERRKNPAAPFTTSRLQQDASRQLGFNVKRTMGVAQRLYEGVELGSEGTEGLITYMRTDSTRIAPEAIAAVRGYIGRSWASSICRSRRTRSRARRMRRMRTKRSGRPKSGIRRSR